MLARSFRVISVCKPTFFRSFAEAPKGAKAPPPPPPPDVDNTPIIKSHNDIVDPECSKFDFEKRRDYVDYQAGKNYNPSYQNRKAIIYKYDESQQPSGRHSKPWYIKWEMDNTNSFTESIMGNYASGDIYAADQLQFTSLENAVTFCNRYAYKYEIETPTPTSPYVYKVFGDKVLRRSVVTEMKARGPYHARLMWKYDRPYQDKWLNRYHSPFKSDQWSDAESI
ncbi:hypothetical protein WA158_005785 [Blastocystis sp. Blastoise]